MTTMMNDIAQVCLLSRLFSFFFSRISLLLLTRTLLHQSEKHFDKKEKILVIWGGAFNKRRDFETTRFSFSFLSKEGKKRYIRDKKNHFIFFRRERALWKNTDTRAHTKPEREKKRRRFFLLLYFVFVLFARTTEREKERRHFIISPLIKEREKTLTSSCF